MDVIIARHGEHVKSYWACEQVLTSDGEKQICTLALKLDSSIRGKKIYIISSDLGRSMQSAQLVANFFGIDYQPEPMLCKDNPNDYHLDNIFDLAESKKCEVLIMLADDDLTKLFANYYGKRKFGIEWKIERSLKEGEAYYICSKEQTLTLID